LNNKSKNDNPVRAIKDRYEAHTGKKISEDQIVEFAIKGLAERVEKHGIDILFKKELLDVNE
jgi:hypothetical protein